MCDTTCQAAKNIRVNALGNVWTNDFPTKTLVYTQLYLDYISTKNPAAVKFFDESGFQLPNCGHRNYGYSEVGMPCLDIRRYISTANKTLNFLVGIDEMKYANLIDGACDTVEFLRFFSDALRTIDPYTQRPVIEVGDTIVIEFFRKRWQKSKLSYCFCLYTLLISILLKRFFRS